MKVLYFFNDSDAAGTEETADVTLSKIIISLSMEVIHTLLKPLSRIMEGFGVSLFNWIRFLMVLSLNAHFLQL